MGAVQKIYLPNMCAFYILYIIVIVLLVAGENHFLILILGSFFQAVEHTLTVS